MLTVKIRGVPELLKGIEQRAEQIRRDVEAVVAKYALLIERDAKANAPVDLGNLRASIRHYLDGLVARVLAGEGLDDPRIAAFVEFGTGAHVSIPPGLEEYARQFYVNGEGRTPAQPFLFPAAEAHRDAFIRDLQAALQGAGGVSNG